MAAAYDALLKNAVPGGPHSGTPVDNGQLSSVSFIGVPGGEVRTFIEPSSYSIVNVTQPGHKFQNGIVQRQIVMKDGGIYVNTFGVGNNRSPLYKMLNVELAEPAFFNSTVAMRQALNPSSLDSGP